MAQYYTKLANGSINITYSDKYVGIGTTNPYTKLQVDNTLGVYSTDTTTGGQIYLGSSDFYNPNYYNSAPGIGAIISTGCSQPNGLGFYTYTGSANSRTERMRIEDNGEVGIGTTNPARKLHVKDGDINIDAGYNYYWNSGDAAIRSNGCNIMLETYTGSALTEKVRINPGGEVGIGTTATCARLIVYCNSGNVFKLIGQSALEIFGVGATGQTTITGQTSQTVFGITNSGSGDYMNIGSGALYVCKNNNVGVNTTSPAYKLDVSGTLATSSDVRVGYPNTCEDQNSRLIVSYPALSGVPYDFITLASTANNAEQTGRIVWKNRYETSSFATGQEASFIGSYRCSSAGCYSLIFGTTGSNASDAVERVRIDHNGNVGIGTTNPDTPLHIWSTGTASPVFKAERDDTSDFITMDFGAGEANLASSSPFNLKYGAIKYLTFSGADNSLRLGCNLNLTVTSVGWVGIGTTNPGAKLHVTSALSTVYANVAPNVADSLISIANTQTSETTNDQAQIQFNVNGGTYNRVGSIGLIAEDATNRKAALVFTTDNSSSRTEKMRITGDGNVGIGTTNTVGKLHIKHTCTSGALSGVNPSLVFNIQNGSIGADSYYGNVRWARANSNGGTPSLGIAARTDSSNPATVSHLAFYTEQGTSGTLTERMVIENGGNVGIGTTSPDYKLDIYGSFGSSAGAGLRLRSSATDDNGIIHEQADGTAWFTGQETSNPNDYEFWYNNGSNYSHIMHLDNSGCIGIGTTNPAYRTTIYGGQDEGITLSVGSGLNAYNFVGIGLAGYIAGNAANKAVFALERTGIYGTGKIHFLNDGALDNGDATLADSKLTIQNDGNVGIGTTSPVTKLHVSASASGDAANLLLTNTNDTNGDTASIQFSMTDTTSYNKAAIYFERTALQGEGSLHLATSNTGNSTSVTKSDARLTITKDGNVGIGTTNPDRQFHVLGGTATNTCTTIRIGGANNHTSTIELAESVYSGVMSYGYSFTTDGGSAGGGTNNFLLRNHNNSSVGNVALSVERVNGYVGIGTTNPTEQLSIFCSSDTSGTTTGTTLLGLKNYVGSDIEQQKTFIDFTFTDGNTNEVPQVRIGAEVGPNGSANTQEKEGEGAFVVYTNDATQTSGAATGLVERMRVDYAGNVGVGTSNPESNLQIGTLTSTSTATPKVLSLGGTYSNCAGSNPKIRLWDSCSTSYMGFGISSSTLEYILTQTNWKHVFYAAGTPLMTILGTGNVGIGTTTPSTNLHVFSSSDPTIKIGGGVSEGTTGGTATLQWRANNGTVGNIFAATYYKDANQDRITFWDGGNVDVLTLKNGGNVGIGITNPADKLHIQNGGTSGGIKLSNSGADNYILFSNGVNNWYLSQDGNDNSGSPNSFQINRDGSTYVMITSAGDVGIGTTQPTNRLDIALPSGETFKTCRSASAWFSLSHGSATTVMCNGGELQIHATNSTVSSFRINSSLITLNEHTISNCCVGIGTSAPTAWLQVGQNTDNDATDYGICIAKNGTSTCPGVYQPSALKIQDYAGDGPSSGVDIDGIVGIHSTRLTYADTNAANVSYFHVKEDSAYSPMRLDGKGNLWLGYDRGTQPTNAGTWNLITRGGLVVGSSYQSNYPGGGNAIISGCVGINTVTPYNCLHVNGTARINSLIVGNAAANNVPTAWLHIKSSGTCTILRLEDSDNANRVWDVWVDEGNGFYITDKGSGSGATGNDHRLFINESGNVGIGTTNPTEKLHVCGNISGCCVITGAIHERNLRTLEIKGSTEGTVLIWENGKAVPSYNEYDSRVLGIVGKDSPDPIVMGAEPVLITGSINEGDFIVTSNVSGHGMRAEENGRNLFGKVIGQALQAGDGDSHTIMAMIRKL